MDYKGYTIRIHYFPTGYEWDIWKDAVWMGGNDLTNRANDESHAYELGQQWIDSNVTTEQPQTHGEPTTQAAG